MKIIQYTLGLPPYRRGGLPRYSTDLSLELSKTNTVVLLYPGAMPFFSSYKLFFKTRKLDYPFSVVEMKNPLPVSLGLGIHTAAPYMEKRRKKEIFEFLKKENPDVIHIHTLMGLPLEFLEVAQSLNIKTVYTTHDFYGLCPKMLKKDPLKELRSRKCTYDCMLCKDGPAIKKIKVMQSHTYIRFKNSIFLRILRKNQKEQILTLSDKNDINVSNIEAKNRYNLRRYYTKMLQLITEFHFNSNISKNVINHFLPHVKGEVVSITHSGLKDNRPKNYKFSNKKIVIGYIGPYDEKKGFFELSKVLCDLREQYNNFEFHAYGDIVNRPIFSKKWAFNHGVIASRNMASVYKNIDVLIVPSLWHETFGFTVLEALSYGDICLVSKNVGAKDLIEKECIFDDKYELFQKLKSIFNNPVNNAELYFSKLKKKNLPLDYAKHVRIIEEKFYR